MRIEGDGLRRRRRARARRDGRDLAGQRRAGRYTDPTDDRENLPRDPETFSGFGRSGTDADGRFSFVTVKPGPVPGPDGSLQAPHIMVSVFARGLLKRLVTRIYFPDERESNAQDPVLSSIEDPEFRKTLVARDEGRRAALRRPPAGRQPDRLLRALGMDGTIFRPIFVPDEFREAVSGRAWLQAMLDAEAALATAEAQVGLIPHEAAAAIVSCCEATRFDPEELGRDGRAAGNPVPPLVKALTADVSRVSEDAARYVHKGATSQDIVDTAAMLVARRALDLILAELEGISRACARLAEEHRGTIMAGRTLLQQALPTTFGLKAAGWLVSVLEVERRLSDVREGGLAAQLGGAAGTLASLGESGVCRARGVRAGAGAR